MTHCQLNDSYSIELNCIEIDIFLLGCNVVNKTICKRLKLFKLVTSGKIKITINGRSCLKII